MCRWRKSKALLQLTIYTTPRIVGEGAAVLPARRLRHHRYHQRHCGVIVRRWWTARVSDRDHPQHHLATTARPAELLEERCLKGVPASRLRDSPGFSPWLRPGRKTVKRRGMVGKEMGQEAAARETALLRLTRALDKGKLQPDCRILLDIYVYFIRISKYSLFHRKIRGWF